MLPELIEKLELVNANRGPSFVRDFESVLAEIAALKSPEIIAALIPFFEDNAPFDELMFSIMHTIEGFEDSTYVAGMLAVLPRFWESAPRWTSIVFMRMLNSEPTRLELVRQVRKAPPNVREVVRTMMEQVNARKVQFMAKTMAVIIAASELGEG